MAEYFESNKELGEITTLSSNFEKDFATDGSVAASFENYVRNCFRPGAKLPTMLTGDQGVSATRLLRLEDSFGPSALDDTYDEEIMKDPLEQLYSEMGLSNMSSTSSRHYPVYVPKQSSEYYSTLYSGPKANGSGRYFQSRNIYKTDKEIADEEWRKKNKQMIIDYKDFDSPRLSPYMYQEHPYVRPQDSRIVCSNFVQITSRPKDNFLEKIDKTLAEIRATPRF